MRDFDEVLYMPSSTSTRSAQWLVMESKCSRYFLASTACQDKVRIPAGLLRLSSSANNHLMHTAGELWYVR